MSKIIFFSLPVHGHINPSLPLIKELVKNGHYIEYYSTTEFKEKIEATGAIYVSYPQPYKNVDFRIAKNWVVAAHELLINTEHMTKALLPVIEGKKWDCIIHDSMAMWGKTIASKTKIPAVCLTTTFAFNKKMWNLYPRAIIFQHLKFLRYPNKTIALFKIYRKLKSNYNLSEESIYDVFSNLEKLNLIFTSSYFQPYINSFDKTFKFIGPAISSRLDSEDFLKTLPKNKQIIYISLGTIYNDDLSFFKLCLLVFGNTDYTVVVALGHRFNSTELKLIPKNVVVRNYVPQLKILEKASLFITHAGMNSCNESLYFGVPMILIPQMDEQTMNAIRVKQLGAGIVLKKSQLSKKSLQKAAMLVLQNSIYRKNALKIGKTLKKSGGYKKGSQEIEKYLESFR